jgi:hypothetical protein
MAAARVRVTLAYLTVIALWLLPFAQCTVRHADMWRYPTVDALTSEPADAVWLLPPLAALIIISWIGVSAARASRFGETARQTLLWLAGISVMYVVFAVILLIAIAHAPNRLNQVRDPLGGLIGAAIGMYLSVFIAVPIAVTAAAVIAWIRGRSWNRDGLVTASYALSAGLIFTFAAWLITSIYIAPPDDDPNRSGKILMRRVARVRTELQQAQQLAGSTRDPNTKIGSKSALSVAIAHRDAATARLLIERGATDADGRALQIATTYTQDPEMIRIVLTAKPPVNVRGVLGMTPLLSILSEWFSEQKRTDAINMLIDAGADVNAVDDTNRSALDYARLSHDDDIVARLRAAGAKERN